MTANTPALTLHQRRMALTQRARILQDNEVIDGFTRTASHRTGRPAGYAVKIDGTWYRHPGIKAIEAVLADLWNDRGTQSAKAGK